MRTDLDNILLIDVKNLISYDKLINILYNINKEYIFHFSNESEFLKNIGNGSSNYNMNENLIFFINRYVHTFIKINEFLILYNNKNNKFYIIGKLFRNTLYLYHKNKFHCLGNLYYFNGLSVKVRSNIDFMITGTTFMFNSTFDNNLLKVDLTISKNQFIEKCINDVSPEGLAASILERTPTIYDLYMSKLFPIIRKTYENKNILLTYDNINKDLVIYIDDMI